MEIVHRSCLVLPGANLLMNPSTLSCHHLSQDLHSLMQSTDTPAILPKHSQGLIPCLQYTELMALLMQLWSLPLGNVLHGASKSPPSRPQVSIHLDKRASAVSVNLLYFCFVSDWQTVVKWSHWVITLQTHQPLAMWMENISSRVIVCLNKINLPINRGVLVCIARRQGA